MAAIIDAVMPQRLRAWSPPLYPPNVGLTTRHIDCPDVRKLCKKIPEFLKREDVYIGTNCAVIIFIKLMIRRSRHGYNPYCCDPAQSAMWKSFVR